MAQTVCVLPPAEDRKRLLAIVADRNRPLKHVRRAHIVLCSADCLPVQEVARRARVSRPAVWRWQARCVSEAVEGLPAARQDAQAWPPSAFGQGCRQGLGPDLLRAARRRRIGPAARWPKPSASACAPFSACGRRTGCSRTAFAPSSAPTIPSSPRRSRTSSASTWTRPSTRWSSRSTRRAKSRRSTARSRACRLSPENAGR